MRWNLVSFKFAIIGGYFIGAAGLIITMEMQPLETGDWMPESV